MIWCLHFNANNYKPPLAITNTPDQTPGSSEAHKELINDMIVPLLHQWTKANALFKPPVINQCRTIELKLTKLWHKAVETSLGKGNLARKNEFLHTLDTLFDILTCKCSIQLCESNCSHSGKRENNSHIDCGCPREKKIPVLELEFIKAQRTKAEGQGSMQMGSIDYSETKKQIANAKKREQIREREQKKKMKSEEAIQREEELCQDVYHFFDIPPINVNATKLSELVDLSLEVLEPPLTTSLTSQELRNLKETPMQVPKWPSHTQSVERCVKMVTEAAGHVYSHERREVSVGRGVRPIATQGAYDTWSSAESGWWELGLSASAFNPAPSRSSPASTWRPWSGWSGLPEKACHGKEDWVNFEAHRNSTNSSGTQSSWEDKTKGAGEGEVMGELFLPAGTVQIDWNSRPTSHGKRAWPAARAHLLPSCSVATR
ncbi:hypothetical protein Hamer_G003004 [Homarus americanus]|uniref:Uncharacterized protein n=1 Tax=Homarus americanus TaxID=6706 RepID=A0A8J5MUS5_HOMAM|nr:hypothetical protein Hamer_G003004 [Homarus americanus]